MKSNQLLEVEGANVAFAFGRFNPAHQGHIEVWRAVEDAGANWFIGTNPSTLGPNDPLTFEQKSAWMAEIYPPITGHIVAEQSVLTLAAYIFKKLRKNENATVAYITDAQDWAWSGKLLNQYNGQEGSHGYYKFAGITHVPSPRVSSATALRDAARADDKVAFYHASGTDPKLKVAGLSYFDTVKQACEKYPLPVKRGQKVKEQDVAEDFGDKEAMGRIEPYGGIYIYLEDDGDEVFVQAMYKPAADGSTEMGHVLFVIDGEYLMPQDLEVEEKYQSQGVASTMYDYVKSKGYKIRRSGQQTDAGAGFWDKHKPGKNVWEQGVVEGSLEEIDRRGFLKGLGAGAAAVAGAGLPTLAQAKGPGYWANYAGKALTDATGGLKIRLRTADIEISTGEGISPIEYMASNVYDIVTKYCELTDCYNAKQAIDNATKEAIKISKIDNFIYRSGSEKQFVLAYRASLNDEVYEWKKSGRPTPTQAEQPKQQPAQKQEQPPQQSTQQQPAQQEIKLNLKPNRQVGDIITVHGGVADGKKAKVTQILGPNKEGTGNKGLGVIVESVNQGVAEGATDLVKKVFKKNGEPVGEVGIDNESSPGNGQWYMKCYAYDIDNSGYDSYEEAVAELKYCLKQGVSEQKQRLDPKCWDGYKKQGTKMKGGVRVNNCVKENALDEKSVSKAQFRTMAAVAHNPEFAKKVGISQEVGKEFHSADKKTDYKKLPKKVDEVLDPTTMSANVLRYLGRKFATAFPWIATGAMGAGLAYSGLLAPLMASVGGVAATITSLGAETALAAGVAGTYAAPSVIQVIKDLFAADENSIQAGIKRWVEKHVGDENDIQEFLNLHAQSAYLKQPMFRWRAEEWKTKMNTKEAEAYLEKHNKGWLDAEKQKVIDAEKANIKPGVKPPVKPATESLDADQKRAGQVAGEEPAKKIGQVLAKPTKQHPYKGRLVGEADGFNGEYDDEAGMAKSNLLTTARAVAGLLKTIQDNDNLPEWGQEKIAKAEMMLVSVWDYLQSQKEQGIDPKVKGVTEAELDFGPDWDEIVKRVGQRAKQGPLKTVWDEKKRVYRNVPVNDPDQPAKEVDEASLATMRDYFAGNDDARDPTKIAQMRDFFNKNKLPGSNVKDKRFASRQAYELWLKQNGLRDLSSK